MSIPLFLIILASYLASLIVYNRFTGKPRSLPKPTGPYAIGTISYHLIDQNRNDPHAPGAKRELMVQVWYPAEKNCLAKEPYLSSEYVGKIFKKDLKDIFKAQIEI